MFAWLTSGRVTVGVSPTYTGCPATEVIARSIETRLEAEGYEHPKVESVLSPPWSSDWLTESGRAKLKEYGIAPPAQSVSNVKHLYRDPNGGVSALLIHADQQGERVRVDALQGAVSVLQLSGTLRILRVHLKQC